MKADPSLSVTSPASGENQTSSSMHNLDHDGEHEKVEADPSLSVTSPAAGENQTSSSMHNLDHDGEHILPRSKSFNLLSLFRLKPGQTVTH